MPHVIVKLWPGKSDAQKVELSDRIVAAVCETLGYADQSVSVGFDEVPAERWMDEVYARDVEGSWSNLTKRPGYGPRA